MTYSMIGIALLCVGALIGIPIGVYLLYRRISGK